MKNAMQLKAIIKNIAKEKHISAQLVMQNFMLERLLERISVSTYRKNFILKGGFLIAAMVGLDTRATMDMDATIKGLPLNEQTVREMFEEICKIELNDDVTFSFRSIGEIREGDEYNGYRVSLSANYPPMAVPLKLDITIGDKITPKEIEYQFKLLLEDRSISVLAYNLETIMAEKLETVISRGDQNTRPRDYYDIYILAKLQYSNIEFNALKAALNVTAQKRGSIVVVKDYRKILDTVRNSEIMQKQWENYQRDFEYAIDIAFEDACDVVEQLADSLIKMEIDDEVNF
ncbi:MAG: nucleotidyl transferase AbiEii/AbiGii toxin family protein [Clostridium sp.]|nr:nucleotidyl transferase AbiEii/AbiGii toxin family protein [Muribaculaceae bacterium]MCM1500629.1 nucleotidyl transferase AbiEii/AbiGii toxin family protein [Clostridium sp.]